MSILINLRSVTFEGVGASFSVEGSFETGVLELGDLRFEPRGPAPYELSFVHVGEGVHATGRVTFEARTTCVRCLRVFDLEIKSKLEEVYYREPGTDEHGDELPCIGDDDTIDIEPLLRESLIVELPFAPLHDPACAGLCARCGADLNEGDCGCADEPDADHPFASLKDLIK